MSIYVGSAKQYNIFLAGVEIPEVYVGAAKIYPEAPPVVTLSPVSLTATEGDAFTMTADATGSTPLGVQWQEFLVGGDWLNIDGQTTTTLTHTATIARSGAQYKCVFTDLYGQSVITSWATLTAIAAETTVWSYTAGDGVSGWSARETPVSEFGTAGYSTPHARTTILRNGIGYWIYSASETTLLIAGEKYRLEITIADSIGLEAPPRDGSRASITDHLHGEMHAAGSAPAAGAVMPPLHFVATGTEDHIRIDTNGYSTAAPNTSFGVYDFKVLASLGPTKLQIISATASSEKSKNISSPLKPIFNPALKS